MVACPSGWMDGWLPIAAAPSGNSATAQQSNSAPTDSATTDSAKSNQPSQPWPCPQTLPQPRDRVGEAETMATLAPALPRTGIRKVGKGNAVRRTASFLARLQRRPSRWRMAPVQPAPSASHPTSFGPLMAREEQQHGTFYHDATGADVARDLRWNLRRGPRTQRAEDAEGCSCAINPVSPSQSYG